MLFNTIRWADVSVCRWVAAKEFYSGMFGWAFVDQYYDRQVIYSLAYSGKSRNCSERAIVAGLGQSIRREANDERQSWRSYIIVRDIASAIGKVESARGWVITEPMNVLDAGIISVCSDSNGVEFRLWQPTRFEGPGIGNVSGTVNWFELTSANPQGSAEFYGAAFDWTCDEKLTAGGDSYWVFSSDGKPLASMHGRLDETDGKELWLPYIRVVSVSQGVAICRALGGSILFGPEMESGTGRYAVMSDHECNMFGIAEYIH